MFIPGIAKSHLVKVSCILSLLCFFAFSSIAQQTDKPQKDLKNTIHVNLTNPIFSGGRSFILGYERVLNKRRSFSVNLGTNGFPSLNIINSDSAKISTIRGQKGFNASVDYRFYLAKENKYVAPRGVYIGPYYSFNYFDKKHNWQVKSTSGSTLNVESDVSLTIHTIGAQLGYQFILWRRLAIDMILLGPGVAGYNLKAELGSNLSVSDKEKLLEKLNDALADKFPGYSLVINDTDFQKRGTAKTTSLGFRYMIQVGFRF
jgi:hypothetical protein